MDHSQSLKMGSTAIVSRPIGIVVYLVPLPFSSQHILSLQVAI